MSDIADARGAAYAFGAARDRYQALSLRNLPTDPTERELALEELRKAEEDLTVARVAFHKALGVL